MNSLTEAASYSEQQLDILRTAFGAKHPATIDALKQYQTILEKQNKTAEAEAVAKQIADAGQTTPSASKSEAKLVPIVWANIMEKAGKAFQAGRIAEALNILGLRLFAAGYQQQGKLKEAEQIYQELLPVCEKVKGPDDSQTLRLVSNLAGIYGARAKYDEEISMLQRAIAAEEKKNGPESRDLGTLLNSLGTAYSLQGKSAEAKKLCVGKLTEKYHGPNSIEMAKNLNNLATIYISQKKLTAAEASVALFAAHQSRGPGSTHRKESRGGAALQARDSGCRI